MYNLSLGDVQTMNLPREFIQPALGMLLPNEYKVSPAELNTSMWPCGPQCGSSLSEVITEPSEAKAWFKRNWKWVALGVGGVAAAGIVLKVVL